MAAHEVILDVYTIQVKKHSKNVFFDFDKFYIENLDPFEEKPTQNFEAFFKNYVKSYDNKFWVQKNSGKAITLSTDKLTYNSGKRIISGLIEGGTTGIGSKIKKIEDTSDEHAFDVLPGHVESIPYYFILWIPNDSNVGLLIVQSIGGKSISSAFKAHLRKFFIDNVPDKSMLINEHVPKEVISLMKKKGEINSISLRRLHLPSDRTEKLLGLSYAPDKNITVEVKISGFKGISPFVNKIKEFMLGKIDSIVDIEPLEEYGIDGNHETLVKFEHDGKTAIGKSSQNYKLSPSYFIEEKDIKRNSSNHPTYESINSYCLSFLEKMKVEIGYKKIKK